MQSNRMPYNESLVGGKAWQFTFFEHLAKKFGKLVISQKVINCKY